MKLEEKARSRVLRKNGMSIKRIAAEVGVAPSSVSLWVRDIELTETQTRELMKRNPLHEGQVAGNKKKKEIYLSRRLKWQDDGRGMARSLKTEPLFVAGVMLYWGEGSKEKGSVCFVNSDAPMVLLFWNFLTNYWEVDRERVTLSAQVYTDNGLSQNEIEQYWLDTLPGLSRRNLRKFSVNKISKASQEKKINRLPYGTARLSYHSTEIVQNIYGAIQELGHFDLPKESKWTMG